MMDFGKDYERKSIAAGTQVFKAGDEADEAYVVLSGEVEISTQNSKNERILLTTVTRGEMFGELALMSRGGKRSADSTAKTACQVMVIKSELLKDKLDNSDPFVRYLVRYLGARVVDLTTRIAK